MLPKSYDKVSEETKSTVQLFIARASGFLQGKGQSDDEVRTTMAKIEQEAIKDALEMAVEDHEKGYTDRPCTAELFVQWFADLVWEAATDDDDRPCPYEFTAPADEGPLSTEFLEAVGLTEEEARGLGSPQVKKEQSPEKKQTLEKEKSPVKRQTSEGEAKLSDRAALPNGNDIWVNVKGEWVMVRIQKTAWDPELPLCPESALKEPAHYTSAIMNILDEAAEEEYRKKRKKIEAEKFTPKRQRRNDGEIVLPGSSTSLPTHPQWSVMPLADHEFRLMNAALMQAIWETRIYDGDNVYHDAGVFAVTIPIDKAWVLRKHIAVVRLLVKRRWYPLRLYTCNLDHFLQVGLWVPKSSSQGKMGEKVRYLSEELYNLLRHWSFQVRGSGTQSLANYLQGYITHIAGR